MMCIAIPCKIVRVENDIGIIDIDGIKTQVSLLLVDDVKVGDYIIVHAGFALHKIDESVAMESLKGLHEVVRLKED